MLCCSSPPAADSADVNLERLCTREHDVTARACENSEQNVRPAQQPFSKFWVAPGLWTRVPLTNLSESPASATTAKLSHTTRLTLSKHDSLHDKVSDIAVEDNNHFAIKMKHLDDHPAKGGKKEVVYCHSDHLTQCCIVGLVRSQENEEVEEQKIQAQPNNNPRLAVMT